MLQVNQSRLDPAVCASLLALPVSKSTVGLWDLRDSKSEPVNLVGHKQPVCSLCFSHDEPRLLCSAAEDYIIVWNVRKCLYNSSHGLEVRGQVILSHPGDVSHACFSMDAARIALCTDAVVKIINISQCKMVAKLVGHAARVTAAEFCPHYSATLVTVSDDRTVIVWDVDNLCLVYQSPVLCAAPLITLCMNRSEAHVAVASASGTIKVFDLADNKDFRQLCQMDVGKMLSRFRQKQQQRKSPELAEGPVIVTKVGTSRQTEGPAQGGGDAISSIESSDSVLSLLYCCPGSSSQCSAQGPSAWPGPSTQGHGAVGQVLSVASPVLVIVASRCMIQVDSRTLDVLSLVDLQDTLPSTFQHSVQELTIGGVELAGTGQLSSTQLVTVVGTLFESRVHSINWKLFTSKTSEAGMNLDSSVNRLMLSPSTETEGEISLSSLALEELSMVATKPLTDHSPLKSELVPCSTSGPGVAGRNHRGSVGGRGKKLDPMNQPLTFKTKVKSSGYTQAPRTTMFQPKINPRSKSTEVSISGRVQSLAAKITSQEYPHDAGPPAETHCKLTTGSVPASVTSLKFSGTGQHLACCLSNKTSLVFASPFGQKDSNVFIGHDSSVNSVSWSNSGKYLLTASNDRTAILWDKASAEILLTFSSISDNFKDSQTSGKSQKKDCYSKEVKGAQFFYMDKFVLVITGNLLCLYKYLVDRAKDDIKRYLTKSRYKLVKSWETASQNFTALSAVNTFYSHLAICAGSNRNIEIYDVNEGRLAHIFSDAHSKPVHTIALNEGSTYTSQPQEALNVFASSATLDCIKLWDVRSKRCVLRLQGHSNQAHGCGIAFSACGTYLGSGSEDKVTYVYDVRQGTFCQKLRGHTDVVSSVAFHPARPLLATGAIDGKLLLFQA